MAGMDADRRAASFERALRSREGAQAIRAAASFDSALSLVSGAVSANSAAVQRAVQREVLEGAPASNRAVASSSLASRAAGSLGDGAGS